VIAAQSLLDAIRETLRVELSLQSSMAVVEESGHETPWTEALASRR